MKIKLNSFTAVVLTGLLCSCASTSIRSTWKSPDYHGGPVKKVAVLAVDEGGGYRPMFEGQFVAQLQQQGQPAFPTMDYLPLSEIKTNKPAAVEKLRLLGADAVLVVRLADAVNQSSLVPSSRSSTVTTTETGTLGWMEYATSYTTGPAMQRDLKLNVYLDTSLYDLQSEKKLWTARTKTVVGEDTDRIAIIGPLVEKLVMALRTDGLIQ